MIRSLSLSLILILSSNALYAQKTHTEISRTSSVDDIQGKVLGDSLFLRFRDSFQSNVHQNFFILPDGTAKSINLAELDAEYLFSVVDWGDDVYFYFFETFERKEKTPVLTAWILNKVTGEKTRAQDTVRMPGKVVGSFFDDGLNIVCASAKEGKLTVLNIHGLEKRNEKTFSFPADRIKGKNAEITFVDLGQRIDIGSAFADRKLFREGRRLVLVVDEESVEHSQTQARTTVVLMNLNDQTTSTRVFFGENFQSYKTWYCSNGVYRVSLPPGRTQIEAHSLTDWSRSFSRELIMKGTLKQDSFYIRKGSNHRIFKKPNRYAMKPNAIYVQPNAQGNVMALAYRPLATAPLVTSLGPVALLISAIGSAVIKETVEGPEEYHFAHYEDPLAIRDIVPLPRTGLISEAIDKYELTQREADIDYAIKGYFGSNRVTYAVYQKKKENQLQILKFE